MLKAAYGCNIFFDAVLKDIQHSNVYLKLTENEGLLLRQSFLIDSHLILT